MTDLYNVYTDWKLFVKLLFIMLFPLPDNVDRDTREFLSINSDVGALLPKKRRERGAFRRKGN